MSYTTRFASMALALTLVLANPACGDDPSTAIQVRAVSGALSRCNQSMDLAQVGVAFTLANTGSEPVVLRTVDVLSDDEPSTGAPLVDGGLGLAIPTTLAPGEVASFSCLNADAAFSWPTNANGHRLRITVGYGPEGSEETTAAVIGEGELAFYETWDSCGSFNETRACAPEPR